MPSIAWIDHPVLESVLLQLPLAVSEQNCVWIDEILEETNHRVLLGVFDQPETESTGQPSVRINLSGPDQRLRHFYYCAPGLVLPLCRESLLHCHVGLASVGAHQGSCPRAPAVLAPLQGKADTGVAVSHC